MRKTIFGFVAFFLCSALFAQTPQLMSYQAVVRNGSNQLSINAPVGMRVSILQGSAAGTAVYAETHTVTTNGQGLATLSIGGGTPQSGTFAGINWGNGPFFLKAETDPTGGSNYTITATSQLLSVPYAQYAEKSAQAANGVPSGSTQGQVFTYCDGVPMWTIGGYCPAKVSSLNCSAATNIGTFSAGSAAVGISVTIPYTGGNGSVYTGQSIPSTGVTGLTATLPAGILANGAGSLTYTINGTPNSSGTANFVLSMGGQTCTLSTTVQPGGTSTYPSGTVHCNATPTAVVEVFNPTTGKIWMDRNLGASQAATSSTDAAAYGDLYQWGRRADGHQCRTSATTTILSSTDQPAHGDFILAPTGNSDWRSSQNDNLWQGVAGVNNPCPSGYRIPTASELDVERSSWSISSSAGANTSSLRLPLAGYRQTYSISLSDLGTSSYYWSSAVNGSGANYLAFNNSWARIQNDVRAYGFSVRCIKDAQVEQGSINNIDCGFATSVGTLTSGTPASGVVSTIPYTGGNGGVYTAQSISSTGVTGLTATIPAGILASGSGTLSFVISGTPSGGGTASFAINIGGKSCTLVRNVVPLVGVISQLNCPLATNTGTLTAGTVANGVSSTVPYGGGNGGEYSTQSISSTGVTGLTATLASGKLANGPGSLTYTISGIPSGSGTASFALSVGGQACTLYRNVDTLVASSYPAGTVQCNATPTAIVDATNPLTGRVWMDRNLGASQAATSSTDAAAYGDLYQWGRRADGHQCRNSATTTTLSSSNQPTHGEFILATNSPNDWRSPQNDSLWQGVNGTNNPCPAGYRIPTPAEWDTERATWSFSNADGAYRSLLKLPLGGYRTNNDGSLSNVGGIGLYWTSAVSGSNSNFFVVNNSTTNMNAFYRSYGYSIRCIREQSAPQAVISSLDCSAASNSGTLMEGVSASLSSSIPYTGGNGGIYNAQSTPSSGVSGLTASISAGTFANGSGSITYAITGVPSGSGTANFVIQIGGKSCTLMIPVNSLVAGQSVHCNNIPTAVVDVANPITGKIWMDRNLGASQAAASSTDAASYGDLYQWGRRADGHQCRNSATTSSVSSTDQPVHGNFIIGTYNWRNPQNDNLWQGVSGVNNPCPLTYRIPTSAELDAERASWSSNSSAGAFASPLKMPLAGGRNIDGSLYNVGSNGFYWSSTVYGSVANYLLFDSGNAYISYSLYYYVRAFGFSVRCLKD